MSICQECLKECEIQIQDDSFDHAFGTEKIHRHVSDCCEAPMPKKYPIENYQEDIDRA